MSIKCMCSRHRGEYMEFASAPGISYTMLDPRGCAPAADWAGSASMGALAPRIALGP